jgi:mxaK protein
MLIGVVGLLISVRNLMSLRAFNEAMDRPLLIQIEEDTPAEMVFARAHALEMTEPMEAIRLYGTLLQQPDPDLESRVHENLGALYLREAAKIWKKTGLAEYIRINTLLASAKDHLRQSLSLNPNQWPARYNLEYAERITPPPKERDKEDFQGNKGSVFATLPSIPGGGP